MTEPRLTDRDLQRLFAARTAGAVDPSLADRISRSARQTRQRSAFLVLPGGLSTGPMRALALAATVSAMVLVLAALAILPGRGPSVTPPPSAPVPPPSSSPSAQPSPSSTPSPSVSPTPSPTPSASPTGTPEPTRPTAGGLAFLTRDTELRTDHALDATVRETLDADTTRLFVIDGPVEADGMVWWKVLPYPVTGTIEDARHDVGWVAAAAVQSDEPAMLGFVPQCGEPAIDLTGTGTFPYGALEGAACFGHDEVVITGDIICTQADYANPTIGPDWQSVDRLCSFDTPTGSLLRVYGKPAFDILGSSLEPVTGRYRVTGHFDDPQASTCHGFGVEGDLSDEALRVGCRGLFVATKVERLGS